MVERFSAIYSNCGFMGIPLANELFGAEGVFYIAAFNAVFTILAWTHGVLLITGEKKNVSLKKVAVNPSIIATAAGILFFVWEVRVPSMLFSAMSSLSATVAPLAMIIAGITIAQTKFLPAFKNPRIYWVAAIKLLIVPVGIAAIFTKSFDFLGVSEKVILTTILAFSCPSATMGTMMAIRFGKNASYAAQIFAFTTILSIATMPLVILMQSMI